MHTYTHAYIYAHIHTCTPIYTHTHILLPPDQCRVLLNDVYGANELRTVGLNNEIHAYTHAYTHAYIHTYTHIHTCTHTHHPATT